ncbi:MAG TPA: hypothetical protein VF707_14635 [Ardenticatenaceae bacterium]|jgi:hypothetical protein
MARATVQQDEEHHLKGHEHRNWPELTPIIENVNEPAHTWRHT